MAQYKSRSGLNQGPGYYASLGATLLGIPSSDPRLGRLEDDFAINSNPAGFAGPTLAGGATIVDVAGFKGGVSRHLGTVTAGSFAKQNTSQRLTQSTAVDRWYCAWRFRTQGTVSVNSRQNMGLADFADNGAVCFGVNGDFSTVNYSFRWDGHPTTNTGSLRDSGVAIDTVIWHIVEMWHPGDGKYHMRFDGGAELAPATPSSPISNTVLMRNTYDNATGGNADIVDADWFTYLYGRF